MKQLTESELFACERIDPHFIAIFSVFHLIRDEDMHFHVKFTNLANLFSCRKLK